MNQCKTCDQLCHDVDGTPYCGLSGRDITEHDDDCVNYEIGKQSTDEPKAKEGYYGNQKLYKTGD